MPLKRFAIIALLVGLLPVSAAFAKEPLQVTITGPNGDLVLHDAQNLAQAIMMSRPVVDVNITDAASLDQLMTMEMEGSFTEPPSDIDSIYYEVRFDLGHEDEVVATNVYHYYPSADATHGYLFYADVINGFSTAEGTWYALSEADHQDFYSIVSKRGVFPERLRSYPFYQWLASLLTA